MAVITICQPENVTADQPIMKKAYAEWVVSYDVATEQSKKSGRPIMLVFSGSDWCSYCSKLSHEVFTTHQFARWSTDNVIKVEVDFPQSYVLPEAIKTQNQKLKAKFGHHVTSYPTVLFVDSYGNLLGKTGYVAGGAEAWIQSAKTSVPVAKKQDLLAQHN